MIRSKVQSRQAAAKEKKTAEKADVLYDERWHAARIQPAQALSLYWLVSRKDAAVMKRRVWPK